MKGELDGSTAFSPTTNTSMPPSEGGNARAVNDASGSASVYFDLPSGTVQLEDHNQRQNHSDNDVKNNTIVRIHDSGNQ